jgi:hypothetical protein
VFQPSERIAVEYPVPVAPVFRTQGAFFLFPFSSSGIIRESGFFTKDTMFKLFPLFSGQHIITSACFRRLLEYTSFTQKIPLFF